MFDWDKYADNDGFIPYNYDETLGDGFAYNEFENSKLRTLTDSLSAIAGKHYNSGDLVNSGYFKTLAVIKHRNNLLSYSEQGGLINGIQFPIHTLTQNKDNPLQPLSDAINQIRDWAKSNEGLGDEQYGDKWSQLYFPIFSACYDYKPKTKDNEELSDRFSEHNWFVPPLGILCRIYLFMYKAIGEYSTGVRNDGLFQKTIESGVIRRLPMQFYRASAFLSEGTAWFVAFQGGGWPPNGGVSAEDAVVAVCAF
jgi:hypothetical protein